MTPGGRKGVRDMLAVGVGDSRRLHCGLRPGLAPEL